MSRLGFLRLPLIFQTEKNECGLACLAMILAYHGYKIDINTLRRRQPVSAQGLNLKSLIQISERLHLMPRPVRLELDKLTELNVPAILHWDMGHFVVLKKVKGRKIHIHDPALGKRIYTYQEFSPHFSGVALELSPGKKITIKKEEAKLSFLDLWKNTEGLGASLAHIFTLSLVLQFLLLSLPFYTQIFIDDVLVNFDLDLLNIIAIGFLFLIVLKSFTELLRSYVVLFLSSKLSLKLGANICLHLYRLPLEYFNKRHVGDIVSRFSSIKQLNTFLCSGVVEVIIDGLMVLTTLCLMFAYSKKLTLIALTAVFLYLLFRIILFNPFYYRNEQVLKDSAAENTHFIENIKAIQGIKLFAKEHDRLRTWQHQYVNLINSGLKLEKLGISLKFINNILQGGENILLVLVGGYAVVNKELSIGMLIAYLSFKDQFYTRVFALLDSAFEFKLLDVHLTRLSDIVLHETEAQNDRHTLLSAISNQEPSLQLNAVGFSYTQDSSMVFRNIDLQVAANETIAIIGPSGCGKSSLLRLILGLYKPTQGDVFFKGQNMNTLDMRSIREQATAVLQDDGLISGSILENITFFDANPDFELAEHCAHLAAIDQEIKKMPMQFETWVGNMGVALSGGQIQRILLARAFYAKPSLLVLDEACSHLDLDSEQRINDAIRKMNIARIIVAHRPQSIAYADKVYLLTTNGLKKLTNDELKMFFNDNPDKPFSIAA